MSVREIIESTIEDTEPARTIIDYLIERDGKPITIRDARALSEITGIDDIRLEKSYGVCQITWHSNGIEQSVIVAFSDKNVLIDKDFITSYNQCWLGALDERNKSRRKALSSNLPERIEQAIEEFKKAESELSRLLDEIRNARYSIIKEYRLPDDI